ncbi:MAG: hypothetical protein U1E62_23145 [Alsobacter sp.]
MPGRARPVIAPLRLVLALLAAPPLAACGTVKPAVAFDEERQAFARRQVGEGSGRVAGYAVYDSETGRTYPSGGDWVLLIPVTPHAGDRMRIIYGDARARTSPSGRCRPRPRRSSR